MQLIAAGVSFPLSVRLEEEWMRRRAEVRRFAVFGFIAQVFLRMLNPLQHPPPWTSVQFSSACWWSSAVSAAAQRRSWFAAAVVVAFLAVFQIMLLLGGVLVVVRLMHAVIL